MRNNILICIACCVSIFTYAQTWSEDFQIGIKVGLNVSNVYGDYFKNRDARSAMYGGLIVEVPLSGRFSIQPEIGYSGQGFDISNDPQHRSAKYKIGYLQIPVLLKVYIVDGLNIHAGPQLGLKVNKEVDLMPGNLLGKTEWDSINDVDFQIIGGLEYKFIQGFIFQVRYARGFSKLIEDSDVFTSVFSIGIGLMF